MNEQSFARIAEHITAARMLLENQIDRRPHGVSEADVSYMVRMSNRMARVENDASHMRRVAREFWESSPTPAAPAPERPLEEILIGPDKNDGLDF